MKYEIREGDGYYPRRDEEREGSTCNGGKGKVTRTREKLRAAIENEEDLCIEHGRKRDENEEFDRKKERRCRRFYK